MKSVVRRVTAINPANSYDILGHRMYLYDATSSQDLVFGTYESDTVKIFQRLLEPGMRVVDVGAYIGFYTLLSARLVGTKGKVYAFEPNPRVFEVLLRNINVNGYGSIVRAIPKAIASTSGRIRLFVNEDNPGETSVYGDKVSNSVEVATVSLDEFLSDEGWPAVHLVKVDVEGAEIEVLRGMRETVRRNPWIKLVIEFNPDNQTRAVGNYETIFEELLRLGFNKFYAIRHGIKPVLIPQDISKLIQMTETTRYINLLCEISQVNQ